MAEHFIEKYNERFQLNVPAVSKGVLNLFYEYDWPGNIRELEHMIEGAMNLIHYDEEIDYSHLPTHVRNRFPLYETLDQTPVMSNLPDTNTLKPLQSFMEEAEMLYIDQVLNHHKGNITQAAKRLGLSRQSLQYRMKKYGISSQT